MNEYDFFEFRGRMIRFAKYAYGGRWAYRFEDGTMRPGEEQAVFRTYRDGKLTKEAVEEKKKRMGQILLLSNMDMSPEDVYLMFKRRDKVEKNFRTFRSVLRPDSTHLQDTAAAFGHVFVTFPAMHMTAKPEDRIGKAGLLPKMSAEDVLTEYSKAYASETGSGTIDYEIPSRLKGLDLKLGLNIFPILRS